MAQQTAMFPIEHEFVFVFGKERKDLNKTKPNKHAGESTGLTNRQKDGSLSEAQTKNIGSFRRMGTVFTGRPHAGKDIGHPAMFPAAFPEAYINACTSLDDYIVDPFLGSGTTIVACENLKRKGRGIEISPAYCAVTLERMSQAFPGIEIEIHRENTENG
jgi:DNA modification methylase